MNKGKMRAGLCKEGCGQQTGRSNFAPLPSAGEVITGRLSSVWGLLFKGDVEKNGESPREGSKVLGPKSRDL